MSQGAPTPKIDLNSPGMLLAIALLIAALVLAVRNLLPGADNFVYEELKPALLDLRIASEAKSAGHLGAVSILLMVGFSAMGLSVGLKQSRDKALLAIIPLSVFALVTSIILLKFLAIAPEVASLNTVLILSIVTGQMVRRYEYLVEDSQSKYYALKLRTKELTSARLDLVRADEIERRMLAADLHDQVLNDLKVVVKAFGKFKEDLDKKTAGEIEQRLSKTMTDIRDIMDDLCPVMLESFGLNQAIEDCLEKGSELANYSTSFETEVDDDILESLSPVEQSLIYRLVQESITNIRKHAEAESVAVNIKIEDGNLKILIEDDGKGINYDTIDYGSRGLKYMKLRADLIDAEVTWSAGKNAAGTLVSIVFPVSAKGT